LIHFYKRLEFPNFDTFGIVRSQVKVEYGLTKQIPFSVQIQVKVQEQLQEGTSSFKISYVKQEAP